CSGLMVDCGACADAVPATPSHRPATVNELSAKRFKRFIRISVPRLGMRGVRLAQAKIPTACAAGRHVWHAAPPGTTAGAANRLRRSRVLDGGNLDAGVPGEGLPGRLVGGGAQVERRPDLLRLLLVGLVGDLDLLVGLLLVLGGLLRLRRV